MLCILTARLSWGYKFRMMSALANQAQCRHSCALQTSAGVQAVCSALTRLLRLPMQVKFVKSNKAAVVRLAVEKPICVELFSSVPQLVSLHAW